MGIDYRPASGDLYGLGNAGGVYLINDSNASATKRSQLDVALTATGITGAGYTNNDTDPNTATTLYDIDSMLDQVVIQSPANAGTLAATGKLGVDTNATIGFDIYSTVRNGSTVAVDAYASLNVGGQTGFNEITLFNGKASFQGSFDADDQVIGIAIPLNQL